MLFSFRPTETRHKPYFQCLSLCFSFIAQVNPKKDCFLSAFLDSGGRESVRTTYHNKRVLPKELNVFRPNNRSLTYNNVSPLLTENFGHRNKRLPPPKNANTCSRVANHVLF